MFPELFTIPWGNDGLVVGAYGFFLAVGLVVGWVLALRLAALDRLPADTLGTAYVLGAALAAFGARALWLLQRGAPLGGGAWLGLRAGEFSAGAGLLAAVGLSFLLCRRSGVPFFAWADAAGPAALVVLAFERAGAFLAGTNFGLYVDPAFPLAVRFPAGSPAYLHHELSMAGMKLDGLRSHPVHPVQLYGLVALLVGLALAYGVRGRRRFSGQVGLLCLAVFVVVRMVVEDPFRVDRSPELFGPVRLGLVAALALLALTFAVYTALSRRAAAAPEGARHWRGGPWSPGE